MKNKLNNVEVIEGDSREVLPDLIEKGVVADRVLMGYLPPPEEFISTALKTVKTGGMIHYDALIGVDRVDEDIDTDLDLFI